MTLHALLVQVIERLEAERGRALDPEARHALALAIGHLHQVAYWLRRAGDRPPPAGRHAG